jgi:hypothetical protein
VVKRSDPASPGSRVCAGEIRRAERTSEIWPSQ